MERTLNRLFRGIWDFMKNVYGVMQKPHETYINLAKKGKAKEILFLWMIIFLVFMWARALKVGVFRNPMFFAVNTTWIYFVSFGSFLLVTGFIWSLGRLWSLRGMGDLKKITILWGYSYLPTIVWFSGVSILFFLFPPPRSFSLKGYALSAVLVGFSLVMFYWKLILYYLTLRIGYKTTWKKIIPMSFVFFPLVFLYSYLLYKAGIFKVPFL